MNESEVKETAVNDASVSEEKESDKKEKKSVGSIIKTVLNWVLIAIAVGVMIFTILSVTLVNRNNRSIFGLKFFIDLTDSMAPDHFKAGDIVLVKNVKDASQIKAGDILTFQSLMEGESFGEPVTHMVRFTSSDNEGKAAIANLVNEGSVRYASADDRYKTCFVTYGTATGVNDSVIVSSDFVLGKYIGKIPYLGYFFQYLKTPIGYIIFILVPFLILIILRGIDCIKIFQQYKKEQMQAIAAENAALEEERAESRRMMEELQLLKQQLQAKVAGEAASSDTSTGATEEKKEE